MKKFIIIVTVVYLLYYGAMITFDLFIKKAPVGSASDDGEVFGLDGFTTQEVGMTEEEIRIEAKLQRDKDRLDMLPEEEAEEASGGQERLEEQITDANSELGKEVIQMGEVEDQGFTMDDFAKMMKQAQANSSDVMAQIEQAVVQKASGSPVQ